MSVLEQELGTVRRTGETVEIVFWHAHLEGFEDAMEGIGTPWATVLEREKRVNQIYKDRAPA